MSKFLVAYDLREEDGNSTSYHALYKALEPFGGRVMGQGSVWEIEHDTHTVGSLINRRLYI